MITYSIAITAALFFILGYITNNIQEIWYDTRASRAEKARKAKAERQYGLSAETDAAMDEAIALVENELGGTNITH